jgi:predicted permease
VLEGDLEELFIRRAAAGERRARLWYWRQVLTLDYRRLGRAAARTASLAQARGTGPDLGPTNSGGRLAGVGLDVAVALRSLYRRPAFSWILVGTLALGIAMSTLVFSVADAVLFEPLPYADADRLAVLWRDASRTGSSDTWSFYPDVFTVLTEAQSFERVEAQFGYPVNAGAGDALEMMWGSRATPGFLNTFGVQPLLGRTLEAGDRNVVVLSHHIWQRLFEGDRGVVGRTLRIEDVNPLLDPAAPPPSPAFTVVGVMAEGFSVPPIFDAPYLETDVWVPLHPEAIPNPKTGVLHVVARLADGVSVDVAQREMDGLSTVLQELYPEEWRETPLRVVPITENHVGGVRARILLLGGAGMFLLLIVLTNTGNLMVTRGLVRSGESSLRTALGATRLRLLRARMTESAVLVGLATLLGVGAAALLVPAFVRLAPERVPRLAQASVDGSVLAFVVAVSVVAVALFTVLGAATARQRDVFGTLRGTARGARGGAGRVQGASVLIQTSLTVLLLVGVGLSLQGLGNLLRVDPGFDVEHRMTFAIRVPTPRYPTPAEQIAMVTAVHQAIEAVPGVLASGSSDQIPPRRGLGGSEFVSQEGGTPVYAGLRTVSRGYLTALDVRPVSGRAFRPGDDLESEDVVIVSQSLADALWPRGTAVGRTLQARTWTWGPKRVVGVVPDLPTYALGGQPFPEIYQLHEQEPWGQHKAVVHVQGDPDSYIGAIREAVRSVDPDVPLTQVRSHREFFETVFATPRFLGTVLGLFATAALILAAVGTFGVLSYAVTQQLREVAIRLAVGASPDRIRRHFLGRAMRSVLSGVVLGVVGAMILGRFLASQLYDVAPFSPATLVAGAVLVSGMAVLAAWPAVRRAARTEPASVLRSE